MMREVLERRFKRLIAEAPRDASATTAEECTNARLAPVPSPPGEGWRVRIKPSRASATCDGRRLRATSAPLARGQSTQPLTPLCTLARRGRSQEASDIENERARTAESPWPDLVIIDGGRGQLSAAQETLKALGLIDIPLAGVAKGPDRDAGRETFHIAGRDPFMLKPRDPVLYFVQRLRDEAHRFAIGSHRARRKKDLREAGLQEIPGIGPTRKRALLQHFGTLKAIERASLSDLAKVPGVSAETARKIYDFFHDRPG